MNLARHLTAPELLHIGAPVAHIVAWEDRLRRVRLSRQSRGQRRPFPFD